MNFFDFATLARKKGSGFLDSPTSINRITIGKNENENIHTIKNITPSTSNNDLKAFELISSMNEELDHMLEETEKNTNEITNVINDFSQLNQTMEILFGEVVTDLKNQIK